MPALPKRLFDFGASFLTAHTARKLRKNSESVPAQEREFRGLVAPMADTVHGRSLGIERDMKYPQFQARVPIQTHGALAPMIGRMLRGESGILWPGPCSFYAISPGTSTGRSQHIPVNGEMIRHFQRALADTLFYYTARVGSTRVFEGRHLFLGGATAMTRLQESGSFAAYGGDISTIVGLNLPGWVESRLHEPGRDIVQTAGWSEKIEAIIERTRKLDISMIAGVPNWVLSFAAQLKEREEADNNAIEHLQALWPKLECFVHGGIPISPFGKELRSILGPEVNYQEVYTSTEGFIAAQDADSRSGMRLLADAGLFFEFLPMSEFDELRLYQLGGKAVPLAGVRAGVDYALLLTTPAGLARYVIGDVVRFVSTEPPRLIYVGRTNLRLHSFGENLNEKELTDALVNVCRAHDWQIVNFHVAPQVASSLSGETRNRHEWWVELRPGTAVTPTGPIIAADLDAHLQSANPDYATRRASGTLAMPVVRLVIPGVFEGWMRGRGAWGGQNKTPRSRNDRDLATELDELTRFTKDTQAPWATRKTE